MINCCIVEDHCDIVCFLHSLYRAKKLSLFGSHMIHFDSHPDLSLGKVSMEDWKDLTSLYESLDTESGISEFLIPLLVKGYLQHVTWIKQPWCSQFDCGSYNFKVGSIQTEKLLANGDDGGGGNESQLSLTLKHPYYLDDSLVCDEEDFDDNQVISTVTFSVCDFHGDLSNSTCLSYPTYSSSTSSNNNSNSWILDICLDYFSTYNPFYVDLERLIEFDLSTATTQVNSGLQMPKAYSSFSLLKCDQVIQSIQSIFSQLKFRQMKLMSTKDLTNHTNNNVTAKILIELRNKSLDIINQILSNAETNAIIGGDKVSLPAISNKRLKTTNDSIHISNCDTYVSSDTQSNIPLQLRKKFLDIYDISVQSSAVHFLDDILPYLSFETKTYIFTAQFQLLLPHHRSTEDEIDVHIAEMIAFIQRAAYGGHSPISSINDNNNNNNNNSSNNSRSINIDAIDSNNIRNNNLSSVTNNIELHNNSSRHNDNNNKNTTTSNTTNNLIFAHPPSAVTIARSSTDGFTPQDQVESIQTKVIQAVQELLSQWPTLSSSSSEAITANNTMSATADVLINKFTSSPPPLAAVKTNYQLIIHDLYVEDVAHKAYSLFLHPTLR